MRVALDTNLLVYAEGVNGPNKQEAALALITRLPRTAVVIPAQALGELFNVLVRKAKRSRATRAKQCSLGATPFRLLRPVPKLCRRRPT